jgi:alpha-D-xyloside xylohydrolase
MTTGRIDRRSFLTASAAAAAALPDAVRAQPLDLGSDVPATVEPIASGMLIRRGVETIRLTFVAPDVVHVVAGPTVPKESSPAAPWIIASERQQPVQFAQADGKATLSSGNISVEADLKRGLLRFVGPDGKPLLQESDRVARRYWPHQANGEPVYRVDQRFFPDPLEGIYGLGQQQHGVLDQRGTVVELAQANTNVAIPFFVSTMGYGLLWNTASKSWFDNRFPSELKLSAEAADAIDYYLFYGPSIDKLIQMYRAMTGQVPMLGRWAYGFIQSKDRYRSAKDLLDIASEYRSQHVPLDMIVQDWFWWKHQGDPQYSAEYLAPFADVPAALAKLHSENVHAMISVWAKMDPQSDNYAAMRRLGLLVPDTDIYDATNPAARDFYWKNLMGVKFAEGWDGFWLDSSEPEIMNGQSDASLEAKRLFIGNGARYTNVFPLMHTGGVHDHWRQTTDRKRVFILTRSGFLGQQRNGTVVWSGDVIGSWMTFRRQISAGLNFQMSGLPYWTTDIAGYGWPYERDTRDPAYQELYARWFQFGTFCPIMRTHGHRSNDTNEVFSYGSVTPILIAYEKLRYRLLPYIYSLAWRVTSEGYTIQRALPMDWPADERVRDIGDQFMFGPAFLVAPVTEPSASERSVYLPRGRWYDFWTGEAQDGGKTILGQTPIDKLPLFVRAGSILPLGPVVENAASEVTELEVRVYPGGDGTFDWYADSGDSYDYEKGQHRIVPMRWNDSARTLTLGAAVGSYAGMARSVRIRLVVVGASRGTGAEPSATFDGEAVYIGRALKIRAS